MSGPAPMLQAARFAEALRPRVMGPRLAAITATSSGSASQPGNRTRPERCHVLDAKYEPGTRAMILYEQGGRLLRGDLIDDGNPPWAAATPVVEPGVAVSAFPHDPELPCLPLVMDPAQLGPALAGALRGAWGQLTVRNASRCRITLLRYRPGRRATLLVTHAAAPAVVAKAYHNPSKAAAVAQEARRLEAVRRRHALLALAPTVAFLPELSLVVQEPAHGVHLDTLLGSSRGGGPGAREALHRAAHALAELHAAPIVTGRQRPSQDELLRFRRRAAGIAMVDPRLGASAARVAGRLIRTAEHLPSPQIGIVHGDCKPSQFLVGPDRICVLDLDHCGLADQAGDVGTFCASLRQLEIRQAMSDGSHRQNDTAAAQSTAFTRAYLGTSIRVSHRERIQWQEAVALERKALRAFARAPGAPMAQALLSEAERCLDALGVPS